MPVPNRARTKSGKWRKKRSDAGKPRSQYRTEGQLKKLIEKHKCDICGCERFYLIREGDELLPICENCENLADICEKGDQNE